MALYGSDARTEATSSGGLVITEKPIREITSKVLKAALYHYLRFERGYLCADEATLCHGPCDMVADTGVDVLEIEVKVTKHDLWGGEAKKRKHKTFYLNADAPTKFYVCVPTELLEEADKWCNLINEKYGIIHFDSSMYRRGVSFGKCVAIKRTAQRLHKLYKNRERKIAMRLCSIIANSRGNEIK